MSFLLKLGAHGFQSERCIDLNESPCPTVMATGLSLYRYHIEVSCEHLKMDSNHKPPYAVPLMSQIADIPWNGLTVASTFSGAGGSCTGYRMAGFKVVWANEFVPAAQDSYKANAAPDCYLDCRDIKLVKAADIFGATGLKQGELDLFDGSPPCQAFSTAGKREKGWGKKKKYEHGAEQCNETLFSEYIRLLRGLMPRTFVAENVSGLVKGTAKGFFLEILRDLKASGYRVKCKVLDAQWLGVPQMRQRTIFIGVRDDIGIEPVFPLPLPYRYSVRDALPWVSDIRQSVYGGTDQRSTDGGPSPSVTCRGIGAAAGKQVWVESTVGSNEAEDIIRFRKATGFSGGLWVPADASPYTSVGTTPAFGCNLNSNGGKVEVATPERGVVVRRKFTIPELKRICSFPDDFVLKGTYAQQWERLGNSVPPVMMRHIAEVVRDEILLKAQRERTI